jgi:hypothetical protein
MGRYGTVPRDQPVQFGAAGNSNIRECALDDLCVPDRAPRVRAKGNGEMVVLMRPARIRDAIISIIFPFETCAGRDACHAEED